MQIDEIDGTTRVFAILGDPIHLVRSPGVFNGMFSRAGINAVMVAVRVPAGELAKAWSGLRSLASIEGVIVTMPHKVEALGLVDHVGDNARLVMVMHPVLEGRFTDAIREISELSLLRARPRSIRVVEEEFVA